MTHIMAPKPLNLIDFPHWSSLKPPEKFPTPFGVPARLERISEKSSPSIDRDKNFEDRSTVDDGGLLDHDIRASRLSDAALCLEFVLLPGMRLHGFHEPQAWVLHILNR